MEMKVESQKNNKKKIEKKKLESEKFSDKDEWENGKLEEFSQKEDEIKLS